MGFFRSLWTALDRLWRRVCGVFVSMERRRVCLALLLSSLVFLFSLCLFCLLGGLAGLVAMLCVDRVRRFGFP